MGPGMGPTTPITAAPGPLRCVSATGRLTWLCAESFSQQCCVASVRSRVVDQKLGQTGSTHRTRAQVRNATGVEAIAAAMLQLEAHLRRTALKPEWDPLAARAAAVAAARPRSAGQPGPGQLGTSGQATPAPQKAWGSQPPSRAGTPTPAPGTPGAADAGEPSVPPTSPHPVPCHALTTLNGQAASNFSRHWLRYRTKVSSPFTWL